MQSFQLSQGEEYIELNKLLKILDWVNSGGEANIMITEGEVYVNGQLETRKRKKMRSGDVVAFNGLQAEIK